MPTKQILALASKLTESSDPQGSFELLTKHLEACQKEHIAMSESLGLGSVDFVIKLADLARQAGKGDYGESVLRKYEDEVTKNPLRSDREVIEFYHKQGRVEDAIKFISGLLKKQEVSRIDDWSSHLLTLSTLYAEKGEKAKAQKIEALVHYPSDSMDFEVVDYTKSYSKTQYSL